MSICKDCLLTEPCKLHTCMYSCIDSNECFYAVLNIPFFFKNRVLSFQEHYIVSISKWDEVYTMCRVDLRGYLWWRDPLFLQKHGCTCLRDGSQIRLQLPAASPTNRPQTKVIIAIVKIKLKLWPAAVCEAKVAA